jgi:hypothetical protein
LLWAFAPVAQKQCAFDAPGFFNSEGEVFKMATTTDKATRPDIYTTITNRIVEQLNAGTRPWLKLMQPTLLAESRAFAA